MRRAHKEGRFGLVLGAGISRGFSFNVPLWSDLLDSISQRIDGKKVDPGGGFSAATRADVLFRHFSGRRGPELRDELGESGDVVHDDEVSRLIKGEWNELIREHLYKGSPSSSDIKQSHPYLQDLLGIVVTSPMTITYNFDSYLEAMLAASYKSSPDRRGRPWSTATDPSAPFRTNAGVILHPNGYLPQNPIEKASEYLVFSEEEFGDQLLHSLTGRYSSLSHQFSKRTCLLIGLSLNDENLRHFLRQNAANSPGHYHFYVDHLSPVETLTPERQVALFEYRFGVYNLITLFLTDEQIAALGRLISAPFTTFQEAAAKAEVQTRFVFYLTGVPGIGKTTTLNRLGGLGVYDEWMSEPHGLLARPFSELTVDETAELDEWVAYQFREKNRALAGEDDGIFVVERSPLDPLSFEDDEGIARKARTFRAKVVPTIHDRPLVDGDVVLLHGEPTIIERRIRGRQRTRQDSSYLSKLQSRLKERIYGGMGAHELYSTDWDIPTLVRRVARVIYLEATSPANLDGRLQSLGQ